MKRGTVNRWIAFQVCCTTTILFSQLCSGQTGPGLFTSREEKESWTQLDDTIMKKEIASFTRKGALLKQDDSLIRTKLQEIPMQYYTDSVAYFSKKSTYIHLYFSAFDTAGLQLTYDDQPGGQLRMIDGQPYRGTTGSIPRRKVKSVFFVMHSHWLVDFPDSAFTGIYEPCLCSYTPKANKVKGKKNVPEKEAPFCCKVFRSEDGKRIYMYMLNGTGDATYEVVWIVKNDRYFKRVVDDLPAGK